MQCQEAFVALSAALDGELGAEEKPALRRHLSACRRCQDDRDRLRSVHTLLRERLPAAPGRPSRAFSARLDALVRPAPRRISPFGFGAALTGAAAVGALATLALVWGGRGSDQPGGGNPNETVARLPPGDRPAFVTASPPSASPGAAHARAASPEPAYPEPASALAAPAPASGAAVSPATTQAPLPSPGAGGASDPPPAAGVAAERDAATAVPRARARGSAVAAVGQLGDDTRQVWVPPGSCRLAVASGTPVAEACALGGIKEAKKAMKRLVKAGKTRGLRFDCDTCHLNEEDWGLHPEARERFAQLLETAGT